MAVTNDDVRHVAALARLRFPEDRLEALARELSGILGHMAQLAAAPAAPDAPEAPPSAPRVALRADVPAPPDLARTRDALAPEARDGFFLVPRLASHEDPG